MNILPKNLLALSDLGVQEILSILEEAQYFRDSGIFPHLEGKIACNLFFEPSTRTQYSFCIAQNRMGMRVVSFHPESSSMNKGESFYDTVKTFDSFGVDALVIRHQENEYYRALLGHVRAPIINGGDGTGKPDAVTVTVAILEGPGSINGDQGKRERADDTRRALGMDTYEREALRDYG